MEKTLAQVIREWMTALAEPVQRIQGSLILERQYGLSKDPVPGRWSLRLPINGNELIGSASRVVLKDAKPVINKYTQAQQLDTGRRSLHAYITGDVMDVDGFEEKFGELELTPGSVPHLIDGRPVGYIPGQMTTFQYLDTGDEYQGSDYVVFDGKTLTAYN
jgi:hypothetical protein